MTTRPFASFHILAELVVLTSMSPSCTKECRKGRKPLCFTSPGWKACMCACVPPNDPCPPVGRNACATGVHFKSTSSSAMCLCTCESNGVKAGLG
nr:uncharacterized protein LOC126533832 isoform X2 [Dermacentor andersoni]